MVTGLRDITLPHGKERKTNKKKKDAAGFQNGGLGPKQVVAWNRLLWATILKDPAVDANGKTED